MDITKYEEVNNWVQTQYQEYSKALDEALAKKTNLEKIEMAASIASGIAGKLGGKTIEAATAFLFSQLTSSVAFADFAAKKQAGQPTGEDLADVFSEVATVHRMMTWTPLHTQRCHNAPDN